MELEESINAFISEKIIRISNIDNGLINHTYKVETELKKYILQQINRTVFDEPQHIIDNHLIVNSVLKKSTYSYDLLKLVPTKSGAYIWEDNDENYWRMTEFLEDSKTFLKVPNSEIANKAAQCFSEFYASINQNHLKLKNPLPEFINFKKRINGFLSSIHNANEDRKRIAKKELDFLVSKIHLIDRWLEMEEQNLLPERAIHADPKISNLLFDSNDHPLAVIDLDTMMNCTLLYDFGDMVRSYCNLSNEDDGDAENNFSQEIYNAVKVGFLSKLKPLLSPIELENLDYAAKVVIYIQSVRFLTDFFNNDAYYSINYENHNLDRAKNQITLFSGFKTR